MATTPLVIIESKHAEASQTTQYESSTNVKTAIDKFTVTNISSVTVSFDLHLITSGGSASNINKVIDNIQVAPEETYNCPEVVGHLLEEGDKISTIAGSATALVMRATGRAIT